MQDLLQVSIGLTRQIHLSNAQPRLPVCGTLCWLPHAAGNDAIRPAVCYIDLPWLLKHLRLLTWAACALQKWVNPMQAPVQSRLPSLEDLTCGNTAGVRPQTITRAQLIIARPLQQVHPSSCECSLRSCCLLARVAQEKRMKVRCPWREITLESQSAGGRRKAAQSGQTPVQELSGCKHEAKVQWA